MFRRKFESGFTLIEICIGIIIVGLMTAAFVRFADVALKQKREQDLKIGLDELRDALAEYEKSPNHPYLPCPAPLTEPNSSNAFGQSVACDGANHNDGTFVVNGRTENGTPVKVRIGAVPIRDLGISSDMMLDPWYRRMIYAVTERNTTAAGAASEGGITVNDGFGHSLTKPAGIARYVLFSAGQDGAGAYSTEGKPYAACGTGLAAQNCDRSDAIFVAADRSDKSGAEHYDDSLRFGVDSAPDLPAGTWCGLVNIKGQLIGRWIAVPALAESNLGCDPLDNFGQQPCGNASIMQCDKSPPYRRTVHCPAGFAMADFASTDPPTMTCHGNSEDGECVPSSQWKSEFISCVKQ